MPHALTTPDFDPTDQSRACDLASAGLPDYCATVVVTADGEERFILAKYDAGPADYWPIDWSRVAPHEVIGLPIYTKDDD